MPEYVVKATNLPKDAFLRGYLECAEWAGISSEDNYCYICNKYVETEKGECTECGGEELDSDQEALQCSENAEWEEVSLERARVDCEAFQEDNKEDLEGEDERRAGHDFYLTRNRHGAGFWDGDYEKEKGKRLTESCRLYGETYEEYDRDREMLITR